MTDTEDPAGAEFDAIIVAGGAATRLGGVSKPELIIGGVPLLDRVLAAVSGAREVVVAGGPRREGVAWTVEHPAGGGPAAAVAAGLAHVESVGLGTWTLVLSVDTPRAADVVARLLPARRGDGAWIVDAEGTEQPLLAVYRTAALAERAARTHEGMSMRRLVEGLNMHAVRDPEDLSRDVDTWDDVAFWKGELG